MRAKLAAIALLLAIFAAVACEASNAVESEVVDTTQYDALGRTYRVRVINGYANKKYASAGERVEIWADSPGYWESFDRWIASTSLVVFENRYRRHTSFIMPRSDVTVEATYERDWDDWFGVGGGCSSGAGPMALLFAALVSLILRFSRKVE